MEEGGAQCFHLCHHVMHLSAHGPLAAHGPACFINTAQCHILELVWDMSRNLHAQRLNGLYPCGCNA